MIPAGPETMFRLPDRFRTRWPRAGIATAGALGTALLALAFVGRRSSAPLSEQEPLRVSTAVVSTRTLPVEIVGTGRVEAARTVVVRCGVTGVVARVHIRQGQDVRRGDALITLDARPFEEALEKAEAEYARDLAAQRQAEASLARERGALEGAQADSERFATLLDEGLVSRRAAGERRAAAASLAESVKAAEAALAGRRAQARLTAAALEGARWSLGQVVISSPVDGKAGSLRVTQGSRVSVDDAAPLLLLTQPAPVYVEFSVPGQENALSAAAASGATRVVTSPAGDESRTVVGELTEVEPAVDGQTQTVRLKALFRNADRRLSPGQLARVTLLLGPRPEAKVVPSAAVQTGMDGPYVYVVGRDSTVQPRQVQTGGSAEGLTVVEKGLEPGEKVVTDGQRRLYPGARVDTRRG